MEIYFVDKVQMNLNKGCIEIKEPASSAGSVKDEP